MDTVIVSVKLFPGKIIIFSFLFLPSDRIETKVFAAETWLADP